MQKVPANILVKMRPDRRLQVIRRKEDFFRSVSDDLRGHRPHRRQALLGVVLLVDGDGAVGRSPWPDGTFQLPCR